MPAPEQNGDSPETHAITLPSETDDLDSGPRLIVPISSTEDPAYKPDSPAQINIRTDLGVALQPDESRVSGISLAANEEAWIEEEPDTPIALAGESGIMAGEIADTGICLEGKPAHKDERLTEVELGDFPEKDELRTDFIFDQDD